MLAGVQAWDWGKYNVRLFFIQESKCGIISRSRKKSFSCKIILSGPVPSSRDGFDVVQLCAVIMGLPVSSVMLLGDAGQVVVQLCAVNLIKQYETDLKRT